MASPACQQILTVFTTISNPLRAKDICHALGTGTTAKDTERPNPAILHDLGHPDADQVKTKVDAAPDVADDH